MNTPLVGSGQTVLNLAAGSAQARLRDRTRDCPLACSPTAFYRRELGLTHSSESTMPSF
jgi:hypothetical protein